MPGQYTQRRRRLSATSTPAHPSGRSTDQAEEAIRRNGKKQNFGFFGMPIARWRFAVSQFKKANCESANCRLAIKNDASRQFAGSQFENKCIASLRIADSQYIRFFQFSTQWHHMLICFHIPSALVGSLTCRSRPPHVHLPSARPAPMVFALTDCHGRIVADSLEPVWLIAHLAFRCIF